MNLDSSRLMNAVTQSNSLPSRRAKVTGERERTLNTAGKLKAQGVDTVSRKMTSFVGVRFGPVIQAFLRSHPTLHARLVKLFVTVSINRYEIAFFVVPEVASGLKVMRT